MPSKLQNSDSLRADRYVETETEKAGRETETETEKVYSERGSDIQRQRGRDRDSR